MKNNFISKKNILFICTPFFEYPEIIKNTLEDFGANVDLYFINRKSLLSSILLNISKNLYQYLRKYQFSKIYSKINKKKYDYVLIQSPYYLTHNMLTTLKSNQKEAIFINYNWDSVEDRNFLPYMKYFDRVFSFDRNDCDAYPSLKYLPLFYSSYFKNISMNKIYDVVFIGGIGDSANRYEFISEYDKKCKELNINFYKYLYTSPNYFIKSFFKGKYIKGINFKKLKLEKIAKIYSKTNCVLDYNNPLQTGLTMRTFEVLGTGAKLITTNDYIKKESFYDEKFIQVISKENISIDKAFIKAPLKKKIDLSKYSVSSWIESIFLS